MKRGLVLLGACMLALVEGCASDPREGMASTVITLAEGTTGKIVTIRERIEDAIKKLDAGEKDKLDLTEATKATEELKFKGREMQLAAQNIRALREPITEQEQKQYIEKFQGRVQQSVLNLEQQTLALDKKLKELEIKAPEGQPKKEVEALAKKIKEAQGEFDSLARLTK